LDAVIELAELALGDNTTARAHDASRAMIRFTETSSMDT
jgi:hypothetical protein